MKKNLIAMALSTTAILSMSSAMAYDGMVQFTGEILDAACTVDIGSANTMIVDLGRVAKSSFTAAGDETSKLKFTLKLKDCPVSVTSAKVAFDGTHDASDSDLLALTDMTGAAQGVAIRLRTADEQRLGLNQLNNYSYPLNSLADNYLDFYAAYVATSVPVMPGTANAVANFTINYN